MTYLHDTRQTTFLRHLSQADLVVDLVVVRVDTIGGEIFLDAAKVLVLSKTCQCRYHILHRVTMPVGI